MSSWASITGLAGADEVEDGYLFPPNANVLEESSTMVIHGPMVGCPGTKQEKNAPATWLPLQRMNTEVAQGLKKETVPGPHSTLVFAEIDVC